MAETNYTWKKIAEHINELGFGENDIAVAEITGKKICIGKHGDGIYAFAHKCPHAGGPMAEGYIDAVGNIVCPLHRYKFSMKTGRNITGEGYYLKTWPVKIDDDGVFVGMENSGGLFGWLK